jgi:hypothetical protein
MPLFRRLGFVTFAVATAYAGQASATGVDEASSTGKGITGGALLGAEAVMLTEAAIGVKPRWAYLVGGGAGAIAGGVGGYFLEQNLSAKTNMFLLSGGMVLAIPTTIAMLVATQYEPPANYVQDQAPEDEPVANPPTLEGAAVDTKQRVVQRARTPRLRRTAPAAQLYYRPPPALVGLQQGELNLSVPAVTVLDMYTPEQIAKFGVKQRAELRMPVFNLVF